MAYGENTDIDAAEDVWSGGGDYTGQPITGSAEALNIVSSSALDTALGTGARTLFITGLDGNYAHQQEAVTLNGVTPVVTAKTWWRVFDIEVSTAGNTGSNQGSITVKHNVTTTNVFSVIRVGYNHSTDCVFTVPAGHQCVINHVVISGAKDNSTSTGDFTLRARSFGGTYKVYRLYTAGNGMPSNVVYYGGFLFLEKTDIKIRCETISAANASYVAEFTYLLWHPASG